jgi:hypothetical protein
MLIGYPADYRSNEEIADIIKSFGRLLFRQRDNVLARVIIKTRVTELTDIPHYIIISEGDSFEGVSLTVQCEILHQNLLGNLPQDEDIPPGGFDEGGFVFPGLEQKNPHTFDWPLWPQQPALEHPESHDEAFEEPNLEPHHQQFDLSVDPQVQDPQVQDLPMPDAQQDPQHQPVVFDQEAQISLSVQPDPSVFSSSAVSGATFLDLNMPPNEKL